MQAKQNSINLSKALEQRLVEMLLEVKRCKWRDDNSSFAPLNPEMGA
ncbi:MAG: type II toxin-antitoxin system CcdA family antitoxin [Desulfomonilia bacterium]